MSHLVTFALCLQRALGRWVRSSLDKGRAAGAPSAEQHASEAPDGHGAARADAGPVHSPFADLPAGEPSPGMRAAPAPAAASGKDGEDDSASRGNVRPGLSADSQEEQSVSAPAQSMWPGTGRQSQSVGQDHPSGAPFHSKTSMSSTQSTGDLLSQGMHSLEQNAHTYLPCSYFN